MPSQGSHQHLGMHDAPLIRAGPRCSEGEATQIMAAVDET